MNAPHPGMRRVGVDALAAYPDRIDVRSPAEFAADHVPAAMNHPVLDDAERARIGTLYMASPFEARKRGYRELLNVTELGIPFLNSAVGSTRKVLAERPELAEPYLRALAQGSSRLKTDREFAIQVLSKYSRVEDREKLVAAIRRAIEATPDPRGPIKLDEYGNPTENVYIVRVDKQGGKLVNTIVHTYPLVSQFWTYKPEEFLKNPAYSRDYPPLKP